MLDAKGVFLFQGDSITDAGRHRGSDGANDGAALGGGYPRLVASRLLADRPRDGLRVYNRGISGNKVPDLAARWEADALALEPDVLSILIGVNDIWHKLNGDSAGTVADYREGYHDLLDETRRRLPDVKLVICEPFVLRCGAVDERWFPEFDERRAACAEQAKLFDAVWVPFQQVFDAATTGGVPAAYWAGDGVHPTLAGHQLMADAWLRAVEGG